MISSESLIAPDGLPICLDCFIFGITEIAKTEETLTNNISSETQTKHMSLSVLSCEDHFCDPDQDCFQDLGSNGLNQMGFKTSAFTFSHIRITAPSA